MKLEFGTAAMSVEVTTEAEPSSEAAALQLFGEFNKLVHQLHQAIPALQKLEFKRSTASRYVYSWKTRDGRTWEQHIDFSTTTPTHDYFRIVGMYTAAEVRPHIDLREFLVQRKLRGEGLLVTATMK